MKVNIIVSSEIYNITWGKYVQVSAAPKVLNTQKYLICIVNQVKLQIELTSSIVFYYFFMINIDVKGNQLFLLYYLPITSENWLKIMKKLFGN